jgi:hypothetical protein
MGRLCTGGSSEIGPPWYGFEPPSLSVAKPLHHTREPKVGSRVGVRPEFKCGLIPIETMEMNTLQGVGDFVQRQAQYLPVYRLVGFLYLGQCLSSA